VITGCSGSRISLHTGIVFATYNPSLGSSDGMMPGFLVEEGGMKKLVIIAISLILLTESLDQKHVTVLLLLYNRSC